MERQTRQSDQETYIDINRKTVSTYQHKLRKITCKVLNLSEIKLGRNDRICEIDESLFVKIKHHKGKDLTRSQQWVLGIYERNTKKCIFVPVPKSVQCVHFVRCNLSTF